MWRVIIFLYCPFLAGCSSIGGVKWYAPTTWFSHAPANAVDVAQKKQTEAENAAIKLAQKSAHEAQFALAAAPVSRPVQVATDSAANAVTLLDQSVGPLSAAELATIRATIAGLLSDNATVRADAERQRSQELAVVSDVSNRLAKAQAAADAADKNLRNAFERENQLANELRDAHALHWILGGVAVLAVAGWVYIRFFLGGIPGAVGSALSGLEKKNPAAATEFRELLNAVTNRHEQATIRDAYAKTL